MPLVRRLPGGNQDIPHPLPVPVVRFGHLAHGGVHVRVGGEVGQQPLVASVESVDFAERAPQTSLGIGNLLPRPRVRQRIDRPVVPHAGGEQVAFVREMVVARAPLPPPPLGVLADGRPPPPPRGVHLAGRLGDTPPVLLLALRPPLQLVLPALRLTHLYHFSSLSPFFPLPPLTRTATPIIIHLV